MWSAQILDEDGRVAEVLFVEPVIRFCAVISQDCEVRRRAVDQLAQRWGEIEIHSDPLPFHAGGYYTEAMGAGLEKELIAFSQPVDSGELSDWKQWTNDLEREFEGQSEGVSRPLNLDPGYVTQAKLVLATTKDRDHRIYLRDGIFGEITLNYTAKRWVHHRWSYPDYRTEAVTDFAMQCRNHLRRFLSEGHQFRKR